MRGERDDRLDAGRRRCRPRRPGTIRGDAHRYAADAGSYLGRDPARHRARSTRMSRGQESAVTIACIQMEPIVAEKAKNVAKSLEMIEQAADHGARLIVLPELCNSGYVFNTRSEAFEF